MSNTQISWLVSLGFFVPILSWGKPIKKKAGKDLILEMHDKGITSKEIAANLGLTVGYVVNIVSTHRGNKRKYSKPSPIKEKIIELYKNGATALEILEKTGAGKCYIYDTISIYKKENDIPKERIPEMKNKILELHKQGLTKHDIADKAGVSYSYVMYVLRNEGLSTNPKDYVVNKVVVQLSNTGKIINRFNNTKEVAEKFNLPHGRVVAICDPNNKKYSSSKGLRFAYEENVGEKCT